jgi:putative peptidoglycan lipid II flippase
MDQIESIVETNFATRIGQGYVSYYANAYTLATAPSLLIGTAISTAAFPRLTLRLAQGRPDLFRKDFLKVLRTMIWLTMPVVVVSYFCRGYLARLIFSRDSSEISLLFGYLTLAIFFQTIYTLVSRWFYAQNDTKTPLFVSVFTISLNIFLAWALTRPSTYGAAGLALAQSLVTMTEVVILMIIMLIRDHKLFDRVFIGGIMRIVSVTGFSVLAGLIMITIFPLQIADHGFIVLGAKLVLITSVTFIVHIGISALFGLEEAHIVLSRVKRFILRPIRI